MDITLKCKISLSKKLRALMGKSGTILLTASSTDGRGEGTLSISGEDVKQLDILTDDLKSETSIMLTPIETLALTPNNGSLTHASIFTSSVTKGENSPLIRKIAVVTPPEKGQESRAVKEKVEVPQAFSELNDPECKQWISDLTGLIEALAVAKNKKSSVDLNNASNDKERAILLEMKEREEAIDIQAWIVNESTGNIFINDLDISLPLNSPYNLSNISASRIAHSKDLMGLLKAGIVKFVSPNEIDKYFEESDKEDGIIGGLEVFDRHEDAEASIAEGAVKSVNKDVIKIEEVNDSNIEEPTENESMIINLTQNMPKVKTVHVVSTNTPANAHTVHGNTASPKKPSVKPIRKIEK